MNTKSFVSGSSILLACWLGVTFFSEVPSQRYKKLDKKTAMTSGNDENKPAAVEKGNLPNLPVSVSR